MSQWGARGFAEHGWSYRRILGHYYPGTEMRHRWNPEALKTQAVAARSYALATLKRGRPFDLFADTRDQVYGGIRAESDATNAAIGATAGQVLTYAGRPALTYYFSTSGGR